MSFILYERINTMPEKKAYVFLDTNIFISSSYNFEKGRLATVKRYSQEGFIQLISSTVVCREVQAHVKKDLQEGYDAVNRSILTNKTFSALKDDPDFPPISNYFIPENMINKLNDKFEKYLQDTNCVVIDTSTVKIENVLSDLFAMEPPFEKKKQDEFKDSIILYSLKNYQKVINDPIWIVSEDNGFRKALDSFPGFVLLSSVESMLDKANELFKADQYISAKEYICAENDSKYILQKLEEILYDADVFPDFDLFEEAEVAGVHSVKYKLKTIDEIDHNTATVSMIAECDLTVNYTFSDEENSVYDTVDHEYAYQHTGEINEEHKVRFCFSLSLNFYENNIEITSVYVDENRLSLNLDDETLVHRERVDDLPFDEDEPDWIGYTTCPTCGCQINHENDGGNGFCIRCAPD
jgi:hypothetical protein